QAGAFLPLFREAMIRRSGKLADLRVDRLEKGEVAKDGTKEDAIKDVFREVSRDRLSAARKTLAMLAVPGLTADVLMKEARRLVFAKGNDAHDYKFSSAALEDYYHITPAWRGRFLATSMFNLRGSGGRDTGLLERTRAALSKS